MIFILEDKSSMKKEVISNSNIRTNDTCIFISKGSKPVIEQ